jgi:hypothetical protein
LVYALQFHKTDSQLNPEVFMKTVKVVAAVAMMVALATSAFAMSKGTMTKGTMTTTTCTSTMPTMH